MANFAKLVWLAAVQIFCFLASFFILSKQTKKEKKRVQKQFLKMNDRNLYVCGNVFTEAQSSSSSRPKRHKEYCCKLMLSFCTCTNIRPAGLYFAFSSKPSRIPVPQFLRPQYAMKPGYCNFTKFRCSFIFGNFGGQWFHRN